MINRFRKKPVVIEAIKYSNKTEINQLIIDWSKNSETVAFMDIEFRNHSEKFPEGFEYPVLVINTLDGNMTVREGDYVIKGTQGEFYPCKPQAFHDAYDVEGPNHNTSCTYQFELAFHNLQDTPELRKIYWSALGQLQFDSNDQVIPPELEECPCCKQPIIRKIGTETEGYETYEIGVDESGNRYIRHPHCDWELED
ncbi:hypothetical protein [Acinetobacter pittii]|uniref:hypothetical protein n=1 Tax=Acinetobacter pittii TaxID=48296 RepID=UPI000A6549B7|nr:hypothetical protein [Acinetobacter pittii]